jgi:hypothetical protein
MSMLNEPEDKAAISTQTLSSATNVDEIRDYISSLL